MGAGEESSPSKNSKPNSTQLHETTPQPSYPDWSQDCYTSGYAPPYPYMSGGAVIISISSYGAAIWDSAPGVYGHPNMPLPNPQMETKASNGKDRAPNQKSKGNLGYVKGGEVYRFGEQVFAREQSKCEAQKLIADVISLVSSHISRQKEMVDAKLAGINETCAGSKTFLDGHVSSVEGITTISDIVLVNKAISAL
ncbi:hypothetical protein L2E82_13999 [Cichorium intybus]|uniref:Uncharacterized protein n=1 Tax=Cichorium intybus TaxID=13427 RepID=A0ACB9EYR7_CICIN|nr:hypothetical protein L2E82_13999 [Cichorium intybus]